MKTVLMLSILGLSFAASAQNAVRTMEISSKATGYALFSCDKVCSKSRARVADKASENCELKGLKANIVSVSGCQTASTSVGYCESTATATFTCEDVNNANY